MTLFLKEEQVAELLTMNEAIAAVEEAFQLLGTGQGINNPRSRIRTGAGILHVMAAALPTHEVMGLKVYSTFRGAARFLFLLYSAGNGDLLSIMEADKLGQLRTGAASGVATKFMAREDAAIVGLFGAGWQARSQLMAVCAVRPIRQVNLLSRDPARREAFCQDMAQQLRMDIRPVTRPEEALQGADVIITATTSAEPLFDGAGLPAGVHINAVGSNWLIRREIDAETIRRSDLIVVDSKEQARIEAGDLLPLIERGRLHWEQVYELGEVVAGRIKGRQSREQITLFKSLGLAIEDVAVAKRVYETAKNQQIGEAFSFW